jgi:hypothetical protein
LVPQITPVSVSEVSSESKSSGDTLTLIKTKVFEINKFLKGSLAQEKASSKKDKKSDEKQKRKKQESALEKIAPKPKGVLKKITAPAKGLFDGIFNFISNILLGRLLVVLLEKNPNLPGGNLLMFLANMAEKVIDTIIGTLDAFGSFLLFGQQKLDDAKDWLKEHRGNDAVERFDGLLGSLTNLFNAAVIVGSVFAALGIGGKGKGAKNKLRKSQILKNQRRLTKGTSKKAIERYTKRYGAEAARKKFGSAGQAAANRLGLGKSQIIKGGLGRTTTRLVGKTLGPQAMKAVGPVIKKIGAGFSRVPIVGSLIVGVSSLLAGEPLGQAAFKTLGSALGGFAGSFIPIPIVGTLIGTTIGTFIGDVLYSLILGKGPKAAGEKFKKGISDAFKTMFDLGGLAVNMIKDGFGRLIKNFPTVDIPEMAGLQSLLGRFAGLFGVKDDSEFMEDGRIVKLPNLALLTPPGLPFLVPHIAASFLPDIFGEGGVVNKIFGEGGTAWGGTGDDTGGDTSGGGASTAMPSVSTQGADLRNQTEGSKIAGELGKYLNREGLKWGSGVTEHPEHGGVQPVHTGGSYHYKEQGYRAIDIGGWGPNRFKREGQSGTDDQTKIIAGIQKFNKEKGVKPIEFITEATDPTYHNDHVHIAYGLGGLVRGITHAMLGEKGKEFVIDNDSYTAIESAFPGIFDIINKEKGKGAVEALMAYTDYERPPEPEMAMAGGSSSGGSGSYGDSGGESMVSSNVSKGSSSADSSWKDIRYIFG